MCYLICRYWVVFVITFSPVIPQNVHIVLENGFFIAYSKQQITIEVTTGESLKNESYFRNLDFDLNEDEKYVWFSSKNKFISRFLLKSF